MLVNMAVFCVVQCRLLDVCRSFRVPESFSRMWYLLKESRSSQPFTEPNVSLS
jgi:hypothetical protein